MNLEDIKLEMEVRINNESSEFHNKVGVVKEINDEGLHTVLVFFDYCGRQSIFTPAMLIGGFSIVTFKQKAEALQKAFARIGISGQYDAFVEQFIKEKNIPKLTQEEIEFARPFVKAEQERRYIFFKTSCNEVLGEEEEEEFVPTGFQYNDRWEQDKEESNG